MEAKLKPFAKKALAAKNERIDPVVQAKKEAQCWLQDFVIRLAEQDEGFEVSLFLFLCLEAPALLY